MWFSADSRTQKLNSDKFDQCTNSKTNVKEHVPVQTIVLTQSYDAKILPAASYLDVGRRIKDSGRPGSVLTVERDWVYWRPDRQNA